MTDIPERLRRHAMITEEVGCGSDQGRRIVSVTMREAADEIERLLDVLRFYADPIRYGGANQRNDADDPYSAGAPYIKDVGRDNGDLARAALSSTESNPTGNIEGGA